MLANQLDDVWALQPATAIEIDQLMSWFSDKHTVVEWGGPEFRYPYTRVTFHEDVCWRKVASYILHDSSGHLVAFGQFYNRIGRIHLARLVVHPAARGRGIGKMLIDELMTAARRLLSFAEFSLFVNRNNLIALQCYESMGFVVRNYPDAMPVEDNCLYMTRLVDE